MDEQDIAAARAETNRKRATRAGAAHHEAAHVVVALLYGYRVERIRLQNLGFEWTGWSDIDPEGFPSTAQRAHVLLAGGVGEAMYLDAGDDFAPGCEYEFDDVVQMILEGTGDHDTAVETANEYVRFTKALLSDDQTWDVVSRLAELIDSALNVRGELATEFVRATGLLDRDHEG